MEYSEMLQKYLPKGSTAYTVAVGKGKYIVLAVHEGRIQNVTKLALTMCDRTGEIFAPRGHNFNKAASVAEEISVALYGEMALEHVSL